MQIVIDIDEDTYRYMQSRFKYQNKGDIGLSKFEEAGVAIKNGIPLPKGHGRLIDADELEIEEVDVDWLQGGHVGSIRYYSIMQISDALTIVEANGGDTE